MCNMSVHACSSLMPPVSPMPATKLNDLALTLRIASQNLCVLMILLIFLTLLTLLNNVVVFLLVETLVNELNITHNSEYTKQCLSGLY